MNITLRNVLIWLMVIIAIVVGFPYMPEFFMMLWTLFTGALILATAAFFLALKFWYITIVLVLVILYITRNKNET